MFARSFFALMPSSFNPFCSFIIFSYFSASDLYPRYVGSFFTAFLPRSSFISFIFSIYSFLASVNLSMFVCASFLSLSNLVLSQRFTPWPATFNASAVKPLISCCFLRAPAVTICVYSFCVRFFSRASRRSLSVIPEYCGLRPYLLRPSSVNVPSSF